MSSTLTTLAPPARKVPTFFATLAVAIGAGLVVGGMTAYAQGWLGSSTGSLANSAGPWSLAAFVVGRWGRRVVVAVPAAILTMACSELGYVLANEIRGGSSSTSTVVFWLTAAVLAGPPIGVAAAWSTRPGLAHVVGVAVIAGVLIGEGAYGWTTVADTTDWRYWAIELLIGIGILAVVAYRSRRAMHRLAGVGMAAATALVVFGAGRLA